MQFEQATKLRDGVRRLLVAYGTLSENRRPCGAAMPLSNAYALLELLHEESMTISQLAKRLAIDRTNVSRLCVRMEDAGELFRQVHPQDGRAKTVCLTEHGKTLAKSIDLSSRTHFGKLTALLDEETNSVLQALELLEKAMTQTQEEK